MGCGDIRRYISTSRFKINIRSANQGVGRNDKMHRFLCFFLFTMDDERQAAMASPSTDIQARDIGMFIHFFWVWFEGIDDQIFERERPRLYAAPSVS